MIIKSRSSHKFPWVSICPYPSLPVGFPDYILYSHRADIDRFLLVDQHLHLHV